MSDTQCDRLVTRDRCVTEMEIDTLPAKTLIFSPVQCVPHFLSLPLSLMQDTIQQTFALSFRSPFYSNNIAHS